MTAAGPAQAKWRGFLAVAAMAVLLAATVWALLLEAGRPRELPPAQLAEIALDAAKSADAGTRGVMARELDALFVPVHAAVPDYADFHYSIRGLYVELWQATVGTGNRAAEMLFDGFDARLAPAAGRIARSHAARFDAALAAGVERATGRAGLAATSRAVLDRTSRTYRATLPVRLGASVTGAVIGGRLARAALPRLGVAGGLRLAGAGASRLGAGAATGAAAGMVLGPAGAAIGSAAGAGAAWLALDAATLEISEWRGRTGFEARLHAAIEAERATLQAWITEGFARRTAELSGMTLRAAVADRS